ncbi:MAG: hypothetical protein WB808_07225 [Candidatus Dormiibacterota bacterium]
MSQGRRPGGSGPAAVMRTDRGQPALTGFAFVDEFAADADPREVALAGRGAGEAVANLD